MKFPQGWLVDVVRPANGAAYADISHGADKYVVGIPGQPFEVRVTAPLHLFHASPELRAELTVEGQSVGICKILSYQHPSSNFTGFVSTIKGQHLTSQFLFGKAETDTAAPAVAPGSSKTGGLNVKVSSVQRLPGHHEAPRQLSYHGTGPSKTVEGLQCPLFG